MTIIPLKSSEDIKGDSPDCSYSIEMMDLKLKIDEEVETKKKEGTPTISKFSIIDSRKKCKTLLCLVIFIIAAAIIAVVPYLLKYLVPYEKPPGDELENVTLTVFSEETTPSVENFSVSKTSLNVNTAEPTMPTKQVVDMLSIAKESLTP